MSGIEEFTKALAGFNDPIVNKRVKKFFIQEGNKLKKETKAIAATRVRRGDSPKGKSYHDGIKRGKVYLYQGDTWAVRVYNTRPHAHLIEDGHEIVTRNGEKTGKYVPGKKVFESAERQFTEDYFNDVEKFIDDVLDEGLSF